MHRLFVGLGRVVVEVDQVALLRHPQGSSQGHGSNDEGTVVLSLTLSVQRKEVSLGLGHVVHGRGLAHTMVSSLGGCNYKGIRVMKCDVDCVTPGIQEGPLCGECW